MLDCSGLPCVDVTLAAGKHLRMLIDTGNVSSVLDKAAAKDIGFTVEPLVGRDGKPRRGMSRTVLADVRLGNTSLGDVNALAMDLATFVKKNQMPDAQGTLAYTAFKQRILTLDYKMRVVRVSAPSTPEVACPGPCGEITTPTFGKDGPPIVMATGFSVNGKPITAQIDTLFSGTMLIYPTSVMKLGLDAESKSMRKRFFPYTDGGVEMVEAVVRTEGFGDRVLVAKAPVYFATPEVHLPDGMFDGTVGHALLKNSVLTLDFRGNRVRLSN